MNDPPPVYPLLLLGQSATVEREGLGGGPTGRGPRRPPAAEQEARLGGKWAALQAALAEQRASISSDLGGVDPELVLVFEVIGTVDAFINAVARIPGFEFLAEIDEDGIDDAAFVDESATDSALFDGTLYLLATNQAALAAVYALWQQYQEDEGASFPHNFGRWKQVFQLLVDLRRWAPSDRLRGTGAVEDFASRVEAGEENVPAEIELWFRGDENQRAAAQAAVARAVANSGGEVLAQATIAPIAYHAMLVTLPITAVRPILEGRPDEVELIRVEEIAFVRPEAQALVNLPAPSEIEAGSWLSPAELVDDPPLVGVLDGLPLPTHAALDGRLILDDPEDWSADIVAAERQHGTAIASLVLNGDRASDGRAPTRRVYIRPILVPEVSFVGMRERVPHDRLAIDLIYQCILRMKTDLAGSAAAAEVRLVNLSIGDAANQLATTLSPWARLLDYLANRFDLLFVVSAGNHPRSLTYPHSVTAIAGMSDEELRSETLRLLVADAANRRLLSPSESVSCLCVGSSHDDACDSWIAGARRDLLPGSAKGVEALPSPIAAAGMGYRRCIKPDLLAPGGRTLFRAQPGHHNAPTTTFDPNPSDVAPGLTVATPSALAGALSGMRHFHGTSGAAALVSHHGAIVLESLASLEDETGSRVDPTAWAVLTKALLVHSCSLPASADQLRAAFGDMDAMRLKDAVSRFYGYGTLDPSRLIDGELSRATAIGWGELGDGEAERFEFPLPPSLAGVVVPRRLILTVAYFPPIRPRDRRHRAAELFVKPEKDTLRVSRVDLDWRTVKRGTVQHEVLVGRQAAAFVDGDVLAVQVNCRALVDSMKDTVRFGLAVTLEAEAGLPIYAEVAARIRTRAQARIRQ